MRLLSFSTLLLTIATASAGPAVKVLVPQFNFPTAGYTNTEAVGVSNNGAVVGWVRGPSGPVLFERLPGGGYATPMGFPGATATYAAGVNNSNLICGQFTNGTLGHGFFYDAATGIFTQFDVPGRMGTAVTGVNDAGDFCGWTASASSAFVSRSGSLVEFAIAGAAYIYPESINNLGQVVGTYQLTRSNQLHGFFRDADGTMTYPLDYPDSVFTQINGLNDNGLMCGNYTLHGDPIAHGFVRQPDGRTISFDIAGAVYGVGVFDINNSGLMTGGYLGSSDSLVHSFIARFMP